MHRLRHVVDLLEVRGREIAVGEVRGVHEHPCELLDLRLDLDLPLVGDRPRPRGDRFEQCDGRRRGDQLAAVAPVVGEPVAALRGDHDRAAGLDDLRGRRHALDRLVEVLVEREAGVRGHDDVEGRRHGAHRGGASDLGRSTVHRRRARPRMPVRRASARRARHRARSPAGSGVRSPGCRRAPGCPRARPSAPARVPMREASCSTSVVSRPARPGAIIFGPPEKPAKKWGSTKPVVMRTSASSQVRLSQAARRCRPSEIAERSLVARVVVLDADGVDDLVAEHRPQLGVGVAAVGAGGDQDHDVLEPHDALELGEDRGDHDLAAAAGACRRRR